MEAFLHGAMITCCHATMAQWNHDLTMILFVVLPYRDEKVTHVNIVLNGVETKLPFHFRVNVDLQRNCCTGRGLDEIIACFSGSRGHSLPWAFEILNIDSHFRRYSVSFGVDRPRRKAAKYGQQCLVQLLPPYG